MLMKRGGLSSPQEQEHIFLFWIIVLACFFLIKGNQVFAKQIASGRRQKLIFYSIMKIVAGEHFDLYFGKDHCANAIFLFLSW